MPDWNELPSVLVIGLDPFRVPGPWDPRPVVEAIERGMSGLRAGGFSAESCLLPLAGSADLEELVRTALDDRAWDCVIVGGGLRKEEDQLELFELVINLIRRHAPQATIAFNNGPDDLLEAVSRVSPRPPSATASRG